MLHINYTRFTYLPRVRRAGHRKYELLKNTKSLKSAMRQLADAMATNKYKRGDILGLQEWYDPTILYEMVKS